MCVGGLTWTVEMNTCDIFAAMKQDIPWWCGGWGSRKEPYFKDQNNSNPTWEGVKCLLGLVLWHNSACDINTMAIWSWPVFVIHQYPHYQCIKPHNILLWLDHNNIMVTSLSLFFRYLWIPIQCLPEWIGDLMMSKLHAIPAACKQWTDEPLHAGGLGSQLPP